MPATFTGFTMAPYAAFFGVMYLVLCLKISNIRRRERIAFGQHAHPELERRVRAQVNFHEFVPFTLILIWLAGHTGSALLTIHALCLSLVVGRVLHAYSVIVREPARQDYTLRMAGMVLTYGTILAVSVLLAVHWLRYVAMT